MRFLIVIATVLFTGCTPKAREGLKDNCKNIGNLGDICRIKIGASDYCYLTKGYGMMEIDCGDYNYELDMIKRGKRDIK